MKIKCDTHGDVEALPIHERAVMCPHCFAGDVERVLPAGSTVVVDDETGIPRVGMPVGMTAFPVGESGASIGYQVKLGPSDASEGEGELLTPISDANLEPDWSTPCEVCGAVPTVPLTGLCGPCNFGESGTIGGDW